MTEYGEDGDGWTPPESLVRIRPAQGQLVEILEAGQAFMGAGPTDRAVITCDGRADMEGPATHSLLQLARISRSAFRDRVSWHLATSPGDRYATKTDIDPDTGAPIDPHAEGEIWDAYVSELRDDYARYTGEDWSPERPPMDATNPALNVTDEGEYRDYLQVVEALEDLANTSIGVATRTKWRIRCPECGRRIDARAERASEALEKLWTESMPNALIQDEMICGNTPDGGVPGRRLTVPLMVLGVMLGVFR